MFKCIIHGDYKYSRLNQNLDIFQIFVCNFGHVLYFSINAEIMFDKTRKSAHNLAFRPSRRKGTSEWYYCVSDPILIPS